MPTKYRNLDEVYEYIKKMDDGVLKGYAIKDRLEQRLVRIEMYLRWLVDRVIGDPPRE